MYVPKQVRQPFVWPGIVAVYAVRADPLYGSKLVDIFAKGIDNADARRGFVHDSDKTREHRSRKVIIVRGPLEELASGKFKRPIMICGQADVRLVPVITNPCIFLCEEMADFLCPISRCVVRNNQFEVLEVLLEKPRQRILEIPLTVIHRQADTDLWSRHSTYLSSRSAATQRSE